MSIRLEFPLIANKSVQVDPKPIHKISVHPQADIIAAGDLFGHVSFYRDGKLMSVIDARPLKSKTRSEEGLQSLTFSASGDMLYVLNGLEVLAINTQGLEVAWSYKPKRMFAFLRSVPLDVVAGKDETVLVTTSSGQMVRLDRKARNIVERFDNDAPQSILVWQNKIIGTDGHHIRFWDWETLKRVSYEPVYSGRSYAIFPGTMHDTIILRGMSKYVELSLSTWEVVQEIPCPPGLPIAVSMSETSEIAMIQEDLIRIVSLEGKPERLLKPESGRPTSLKMQGMDKLLVGTHTGTVERFTLPNMKGELLERPVD